MTSEACSGPDINVNECGSWWTHDTTVYDMEPPHGVHRGRAAWVAKLSEVLKKDPHDVLLLKIDNAGRLAHTELAWVTGFWTKFYGNKKIHHGRYSAIMRFEEGAWKQYIVATIEMDTADWWQPVQNGLGGPLMPIAQQMMRRFALGYNEDKYGVAFSHYAPDAQLPFMKSLGGTSIYFAEHELYRQKSYISEHEMTCVVDDVLANVIPGDKDLAVFHGFSKITDKESNIYTYGKFSYLVVMERSAAGGRWQITYDFSPNCWVQAGPTGH